MGRRTGAEREARRHVGATMQEDAAAKIDAALQAAKLERLKPLGSLVAFWLAADYIPRSGDE